MSFLRTEKKIEGKTANEWFELGFEETNPKMGIEYYSKTLELNPEFEEAWYNKGIALGKLERYNEALQCYEKSLDLNPYSEETWFNKGEILNKLGKFEEALECFEEAYEINPDDREIWISKGGVLDNLGKYEKALECYDRAIELNPEDEEIWFKKGFVLDTLGRYEEGLKCYDKALEIYPEFEEAWYNKGIALGRLERYNDALECYNKALELNPEDKDANNNKEITIQKIEEQKKTKVKLATVFPSRPAGYTDFPRETDIHIGDATTLKLNTLQVKARGDIEANNTKNIPKKIIEPTSKGVTQEDINIISAFGYKGATIIFKVKIENNTNEPISDIRLYPYVPTVFLLREKEKSIALIEPKSSQTATFEIRPTGECGDCNVSGRVNYYDMVSKKHLDIKIESKSLSIICPMLHRKEISEDAWRDLVSGFIKAEETTTDVPIDGEGLFGIISEILKDLNLFMLPAGINKTPQIFRGTARFYGEGVKGLRYAAQIEVVGGARKSKLILKAWAEKEDALTGFYHGVLDEIEKRVKVKEYIDDSIVQYNVHIGDKIGTLVKDSVVQRSTFGAGTRKCPNCGREVEANEKFCLECGAKIGG